MLSNQETKILTSSNTTKEDQTLLKNYFRSIRQYQGIYKVCDLNLQEVYDENEFNYIKNSILNKPKSDKTPILIKIQKSNQFYLFGDKDNNEKWDFTEISDYRNILNKLPFNDEIIEHSDERFTLDLINLLHKGHGLYEKEWDVYFTITDMVDSIPSNPRLFIKKVNLENGSFGEDEWSMVSLLQYQTWLGNSMIFEKLLALIGQDPQYIDLYAEMYNQLKEASEKKSYLKANKTKWKLYDNYHNIINQSGQSLINALKNKLNYLIREHAKKPLYSSHLLYQAAAMGDDILVEDLVNNLRCLDFRPTLINITSDYRIDKDAFIEKLTEKTGHDKSKSIMSNEVKEIKIQSENANSLPLFKAALGNFLYPSISEKNKALNKYLADLMKISDAGLTQIIIDYYDSSRNNILDLYSNTESIKQLTENQALIIFSLVQLHLKDLLSQEYQCRSLACKNQISNLTDEIYNTINLIFIIMQVFNIQKIKEIYSLFYYSTTTESAIFIELYKKFKPTEKIQHFRNFSSLDDTTLHIFYNHEMKNARDLINNAQNKLDLLYDKDTLSKLMKKYDSSEKSTNAVQSILDGEVKIFKNTDPLRCYTLIIRDLCEAYNTRLKSDNNSVKKIISHFFKTPKSEHLKKFIEELAQAIQIKIMKNDKGQLAIQSNNPVTLSSANSKSILKPS